MMRIVLSSFAVLGAIAATPQSTGIERLAWLRGCWEAASPARVVEERWSAPRAHTMVSTGRTMRGDSLVEYEMVLLRERGGVFTYEAHPSGQLSAVFTARVVSDTSVVFENQDHDFPQRVGYRRAGADTLTAWVEGSMGGRSRRVDFRYARVRCD